MLGKGRYWWSKVWVPVGIRLWFWKQDEVVVLPNWIEKGGRVTWLDKEEGVLGTETFPSSLPFFLTNSNKIIISITLTIQIITSEPYHIPIQIPAPPNPLDSTHRDIPSISGIGSRDEEEGEKEEGELGDGLPRLKMKASVNFGRPFGVVWGGLGGMLVLRELGGLFEWVGGWAVGLLGVGWSSCSALLYYISRWGWYWVYGSGSYSHTWYRRHTHTQP